MELSTELVDQALSDTPYKCTKSITYHEIWWSAGSEIEIFEAELTDGEKYARVRIPVHEFDAAPNKMAYMEGELMPYLEALEMMVH